MDQCRRLDRLAGSGNGSASTLLVLLGLQKRLQLLANWVKIGKMDGWRMQVSCQSSKVLGGSLTPELALPLSRSQHF